MLVMRKLRKNLEILNMFQSSHRLVKVLYTVLVVLQKVRLQQNLVKTHHLETLVVLTSYQDLFLRLVVDLYSVSVVDQNVELMITTRHHMISGQH